MTLQQIIDLAKKGKLKNLPAISKDDEAIIGFINLGLIELYKRFYLKVSEHVITLVDGQTIYDMPSDYMWLIAAYGEVDENEDKYIDGLPINVEDEPNSVNTVGWSQVQVPITATGAYISIIYTAAPTWLTIDNVESTIPVPPQFIEALLEYIGYEANNTFNESGKLESDSYYQHFEASCARIEQRGMLSSDDLDMMARNMRGFV